MSDVDGNSVSSAFSHIFSGGYSAGYYSYKWAELLEADAFEKFKNDGIFITESHYLLPLIKDVQYDTIYHEHLRYYSLGSLNFLFKKHGLEIIHVKEIPTHGGYQGVCF